MNRLLTIAAAAAATLTLAPGAAIAQNRHYVATPVTAPAKTTVITRNVAWNCGGGVCTAPKGNQRDSILCEVLVRQVGALSAFTAKGVAFDADALAKCNAKAR